MDYIPYTQQNAEAFFAQLEQWNDEDEYTRCIQAPVSYTHLDVYKRQVCELLLGRLKECVHQETESTGGN